MWPAKTSFLVAKETEGNRSFSSILPKKRIKNYSKKKGIKIALNYDEKKQCYYFDIWSKIDGNVVLLVLG